MRLLLDLVHPADALFFHRAVRQLEAEGAQVRIASRDKDVLPHILDALGHEHEVLTRAGVGILGLGRELALRDLRLWRLARRFRPDAMAGFGGVAISHVGWATGIPSISFYDSEHARLQIRLALPFIGEWHVPECWWGPEAKGRTYRFPGNKQLAYLHPDHFTPEPGRAIAAGWEPDRDNFVMRLVAWKAGHDIGKSGMSAAAATRLALFLAARGRLHVTAEGSLPEALEPYRYRGDVLDFHHLLAHCRLSVGESATVASESVALGVPTVLFCAIELGYVAEQEQAGLVRHVRGDEEEVFAAVGAALAEAPLDFRTRARTFVAEKGDLNRYIAAAIAAAARRKSNRPGGAVRPSTKRPNT
jgi:predicted glycosyltransferase